MSIRLTASCLCVWVAGFCALANPAKAGDMWCKLCNACRMGKCETPHKIFGNKAEIEPRETCPLTLQERFERAGNPLCLSPLADWSNKVQDWGYYVGGGNPLKCGGRCLAGERRFTSCEGTWGWDYVPCWSHVRLRWWHGRRYQDGEGQYRANGVVEPFSPSHGPKGIIMDGLIH